MKKHAILILTLVSALLLSACGGESRPAAQENAPDRQQPVQGDREPPAQDNRMPGFQNGEAPDGEQPEMPAEETLETVVINTTELFSNRDFETAYTEKGSAVISLNGSTASCASNAVQINGSTVTILDEGTYILSGTLDDGQIIVKAGKDDKTQLVLNGVSIHSETSAPIYVLQADKVFVTLAEGSGNTLSNGGTFTAIDENNIDAVVFSKEDITFNGAGSLTIDSPAGHGVVSKDSLTITGGKYHITAASHGIDGKDDVCIADGTFSITSGKDGVHAEHDEDASLGYLYIENGTFDITSGGDGLSASASAQIEDGVFRIVSGGGSDQASQQTSGGSGFGGRGGMGGMRPGSMGANGGTTQTEETTADSTSSKGIKGSAGLFINGGTFTIDASDDAIHSNTDITVTAGTFALATGDDGFHADQTLTVSAGTINISECYEGLEALHIVVSGGDIRVDASDDGLNAAGGMDSSGFGGSRGGDMFGGRGGKGGMGGMGGMSGGSSGGSILISGGTMHLNAGGDCIDANGTLEITGGNITVCSAMNGDTSVLDYDRSAVISGGTFVGSGVATMAQTFSGSEQGVITLRLGSTQKAGTEIQVTDAEGRVVFSYTPEQNYYYVIVSSPEIVKGETYSVSAGTSGRTLAAD